MRPAQPVEVELDELRVLQLMRVGRSALALDRLDPEDRVDLNRLGVAARWDAGRFEERVLRPRRP